MFTGLFSQALSKLARVDVYANDLKMLFDGNPAHRGTNFAEDAEGELSS